MTDAHHTIFPTGSPISQSDGELQSEPMPVDHDAYQKVSASMLRKLSPLLRVREDADKVYGKGYFERHYSEADKKLKLLLHKRAMLSWANALNDENLEERSKAGLGDSGGVTIIINLVK